MSYRSSSGMCSKSYDSLWRVSQTYNLAHVLDLNLFAEFAGQVLAVSDLGRGRSRPSLP
jgi:hypothetical protein